MNRKFFLLGVVTIGLLLLGSLPTSVAQDNQGTDPFGDLEGTIDISYDISLTNVWSVGPTAQDPSTDLTNTNLRYNLTSMKSPLDAFFNVGAFMFGSSDSGPLPEFMINGTFEGSELFVKILNDQVSPVDPSNRLLDWQAALTLKDDINISVLIPEEADLGGFPMELMPTSFVVPGGSGIPPLPVIRSTTNFSSFEDISNLASNFGYDGLPFVSPSIFFVDSLADADNYWTNFNVTKMFKPSDDPENNHSMDLETVLDGNGFDLSFDAVFFNTTMNFGNISLVAHWNVTGWLDHFEFVLYADLDQSGSLDAEEEFSVMFDFLNKTQAPIPLKVGDKGEYILDMSFSVTVDIENDTEEAFVNTILDEISASISELSGEKLINYTVDAMDGLYYHIDGYLLDLPRFMKDRLGFLFGEESTVGFGAQEPLPPIEDYYLSINDMNGRDGGFALNLFDAGVYKNDTMFYEIYDGHYYWDNYLGYDVFNPLQAQDENTTIVEGWFPGVVNAYLYEKFDWDTTWDDNLSMEDNLAALEGDKLYEGPVEYVEVNDTWYDAYNDEWNYNYYDVIQIVDNESFTTGVDYIAVFEIEPLPGTGFTSYKPMMSPYMMMFMDNGPEPVYNIGFGAQDVIAVPQMSLFGLAMPDPQSLIPMPMRTPDWDVVGGPMVFIEGYMDQIIDIVTSPEYVDFLESMAASDPGDLLDIAHLDMGFDWIVNATHAGAANWVELDMTMVDNDTGNMEIVTQSVVVDNSESYFWSVDGRFNSATVSVQASIDMSSEDWVIPGDTTTTTTTVPPEDTTTTTETGLELTPGFEIVFTIGSLIALPLFFKKRR
jgi:hypothetical protein